MDTGSFIIPSTHDFSHGAGHNLPVNSGKLLVECRISSALFQSPLCTMWLKSGIKLPSGHPLWQKGIPQSMHLEPCF